MLEVCLGDNKDKTGIVCECRMNFNLLKPYLDFLMSKGYVETIEGTSYFRTTAAGMEAMRDFNKALDRVKGDHTYITKKEG